MLDFDTCYRAMASRPALDGRLAHEGATSAMIVKSGVEATSVAP